MLNIRSCDDMVSSGRPWRSEYKGEHNGERGEEATVIIVAEFAGPGLPSGLNIVITCVGHRDFLRQRMRAPLLKLGTRIT